MGGVESSGGGCVAGQCADSCRGCSAGQSDRQRTDIDSPRYDKQPPLLTSAPNVPMHARMMGAARLGNLRPASAMDARVELSIRLRG